MNHHIDAERADFHKHILAPKGFYDKGLGWIDINPDGTYKHPNIQERWETWQAARRAPAAPVPQQALSLLRWAEFLLATSAPMTSQQKEAWPSLKKAADEMRTFQKAMLTAVPPPGTL